MEPFLHRVARIYLENEHDSLLDYCFVFPNKRSGVFFQKHLRAMAGSTIIEPRILPLDRLLADMSPLVEAGRLEQLLTLYNVYTGLQSEPIDFDRFRFWGEMIINDFDDVDRYLVDPSALFVNVRRLREISANYFTPEQVEIMKRYWGETPPDYNPEEFWKHVNDNGTGRKFIRLWESLESLYTEFNRTLHSRGLATAGRFYRDAADALKQGDTSRLPYRRIIFVGFNVLSTAEIAIFERLKALGMADFYWDYNSPAFRLPGNRGARFIERNVAAFPSLYDIGEEPIDTFPQIDIIGVPSAVGQVKKAGEIISQWCDEKVIADTSNAVDTAVVLPDEQLFIPMIHSIDSRIRDINVTMGYPMRHTPIAMLMRSIVSLHSRARSVRDVMMYFHDDVVAIASHPLVMAVAPDECAALLGHLNRRRIFTIAAADILAIAPSLGKIFCDIKDLNDVTAVIDYTDAMTQWVMDAAGQFSTDQVEVFFIQAYREALLELADACRRHRVNMHESTFFQLLERSISGATVNFTGEPLRGLQIMGVLETRSLDFDNIIILSMNERVFPRKQFSRSFIPESLRRAYGMSTVDFQESFYAYYFFRLISRARRVTLLYDARQTAGRSHEISRYLAQLVYLYPAAKVNHIKALYNQWSADINPVIVRKTPQVMEKLMAYTRAGSGKNLSASSINEFINCPLNFYLKFVEGFNPNDEIVDYMDASTYGSVLHEVVENLYKGLPSATVTDAVIDSIIDSPVTIDRLITAAINEKFNHLEPGDLSPLRGEAELLGRVMHTFVVTMLKAEKAFTPFEFTAAEYLIESRMEINPSLTVNIKQYIDRIDRVNIGDPARETVRVVDYKTGSDTLTATSVDDFFDATRSKRPKAMLQLFFYCNAYAMKNSAVTGKPIQPFIYKFLTMKTQGLQPLRIDKKAVTDYREYNDRFVELFKATIERIFDPDVPFTQADDDHACTFCSFKAICNRSTD